MWYSLESTSSGASTTLSETRSETGHSESMHYISGLCNAQVSAGAGPIAVAVRIPVVLAVSVPV